MSPPGPPIAVLRDFDKFNRSQGNNLREPGAIERFVSQQREDLKAALNSDTLLHGQRTQNLFEALVVSLGSYTLLKTEDAGRVHPEATFEVPDFRIILKNDSHVLVEVKNHHQRDPLQLFTIRVTYLDRLLVYAKLMGCPLKLAVYWSRWGLWTLFDPDDLKPVKEGVLGIDMATAMQVNEMAIVGDRMLATTPPLRMVFPADASKPRALSPDGEATLIIADVKLFCADKEITDKLERDILWIFMRFGDWEVSEAQPIHSGDQQDGIQFVWTPREQVNAGFEIIGTLSSMFSRYYARKTLGEGGVEHLEADFTPGWFAPLVTWSKERTPNLPLWLFIIGPNRAERPISEPASRGEAKINVSRTSPAR